MADSHEKGAFRAEIPVDAVEEALRSVERIAGNGEAPNGVAVEVEDAPAPAADGDALAAQVRSLEAQLELSQTKGRETLERLRDEHEKLLRTAADLENYKKRAAKERDEVQRFGIEKVVKDLLPVVDGLDRALSAAPAEDAVAKGVSLVRSALESALSRHGVKAFSALGKPFDPAVHEALLQVPTAESAPGTVVLEHARGFTLNDRLVRPAMVGVAVALPPAAPEGGASADQGT